MIAALFVMRDGPYSQIPGVDPWDEARDARRYAGPHPVVAHPPCERWGRYWHGGPSARVRRVKGDDAGCFAAALAAVRAWGGVLEHPAASHAWAHFGLARPPRAGGWVKADDFGGWTCCVDQKHYGHRAQKATWLYAVGCNLPELAWGKSSGGIRLDAGFHSAEERRRLRRHVGAIERLSKYQRTATPPAFRDLLISIAAGDTKEGAAPTDSTEAGEPENGGGAFNALREALREKLSRDYRGLDCAGADSEASFFEGLETDLKEGVSEADILLHIFDRYGRRNENKEMAEEYLQLVLALLPAAPAQPPGHRHHQRSGSSMNQKQKRRLQAENEMLRRHMQISVMHSKVPAGTAFYSVKLKNRRVLLGKKDGIWYPYFKNLNPGTREIHKVSFALTNEAMQALIQLAFMIEAKEDQPTFIAKSITERWAQGDSDKGGVAPQGNQQGEQG